MSLFIILIEKRLTAAVFTGGGSGYQDCGGHGISLSSPPPTQTGKVPLAAGCIDEKENK